MKHIRKFFENLVPVEKVIEELKSITYIIDDEEEFEVGFRKSDEVGEQFLYLMYLEYSYDEYEHWGWSDEIQLGNELLKEDYYKEFYDRSKEICNKSGYDIKLQTIPYNPETGDILKSVAGRSITPTPSPMRMMIIKK